MNWPVSTPTLLVDKAKCLANIKAMADKAKRNDIRLRPHFKTHQSRTIGNWFKDFGVDAITVSSLKMAEYFALDGWQDITVAFPVNILEMELINQLAATVNLNLVVESGESLQALKSGLRFPVNVFIKVDAGYGRTGIDASDHDTIAALIESVIATGHTIFKGFLSHSGHSYYTRHDLQSLNDIHDKSRSANDRLRVLSANYIDDCEISVGDTPTCSLVEDFSWATEIRPGNFVFYDLSQWMIGSCSLEQISVALACPVVSKHADRSEIILYGGGVHFSKDHAEMPGTDATFYGLLVEWNGKNWNTTGTSNYLRSISQEHGILKVEPDLFEKYKVGDIALVLPVHSCMTADLLRQYLTTDGEWINE
ncbi:MAG: alanine racemase [Bacteroidota bacterium]